MIVPIDGSSSTSVLCRSIHDDQASPREATWQAHSIATDLASKSSLRVGTFQAMFSCLP